MSRENLDELRARVGLESQAFQAAVDDFDQAVATALGVNRTDLRCLEVLMRGGATPGALAAELRLTSGSVTTMLDRLAKLDYIARHPEPGDRRKVLVKITPDTQTRLWGMYGPIVEEGQRELAKYTAAELKTIIAFLSGSRELQERQRGRIAGPASD